jgi:hypothetical protein
VRHRCFRGGVGQSRLHCCHQATPAFFRTRAYTNAHTHTHAHGLAGRIMLNHCDEAKSSWEKCHKQLGRDPGDDARPSGHGHAVAAIGIPGKKPWGRTGACLCLCLCLCHLCLCLCLCYLCLWPCERGVSGWIGLEGRAAHERDERPMTTLGPLYHPASRTCTYASLHSCPLPHSRARAPTHPHTHTRSDMRGPIRAVRGSGPGR